MANEEKFVITLDVDGQSIKADYNRVVYSGIVGALKIKLNLVSWDEENTVIRFCYGESEPIDIIVSSEYVDVPQNVIRSPGFTIAIGGYKSEGNVLERFVPTNAVFISVIRNGYGSPDAATGTIEDVLSLEGQLIALARTGEKLPYVGDNGNWYTYDVENKVYVDSGKSSKGERGKDGPIGEQGDPGEPGYTPRRGTDYWTEEDKAEIIEEATEAATQKVDLTEYVKKTDYATGTKGGVVKAYSCYISSTGVGIGEDGTLYMVPATDYDIDNKAKYRAITPHVLEYAVKSCTNQDAVAELTEEKLKLPPSTAFVKFYIGDIYTVLKAKADASTVYKIREVDALIGDIDTALENIIAKYGLGGDGV